MLPSANQVYSLSQEATTIKKDWNKIDDTTPQEVFPTEMLDHELSISVLKFRGQLRVQIFDREARKNEKKASSHKLRLKSQQDDEDHDFSDLQGAYAGDIDC